MGLIPQTDHFEIEHLPMFGSSEGVGGADIRNNTPYNSILLARELGSHG